MFRQKLQRDLEHRHHIKKASGPGLTYACEAMKSVAEHVKHRRSFLGQEDLTVLAVVRVLNNTQNIPVARGAV